jgi:hypothetical protein
MNYTRTNKIVPKTNILFASLFLPMFVLTCISMVGDFTHVRTTPMLIGISFLIIIQHNASNVNIPRQIYKIYMS